MAVTLTVALLPLIKFNLLVLLVVSIVKTGIILIDDLWFKPTDSEKGNQWT